MNRQIGALVLSLLTASPALAQVSISSKVETGWTSNATDSGGGPADFYATHQHEGTFETRSDNLVLRGTLAFTQTRFAKTSYQDDTEALAGIEAQLALGDAAALRLGFATTQFWTGDSVAIGSAIIPIAGRKAEHELLAELTVVGTDQQARIAVSADLLANGLSSIGLPGVAPQRLGADVALVTGTVAWEKALASDVAVIGGMSAWFTHIPVADQVGFLRAPADGGRINAGLRLKQTGISFEGQGGIDLVWPKGAGTLLLRGMPYMSLQAGIAPVEGVTLAASALTGLELVDPIDSISGKTLEVSLVGNWAVSPKLDLNAKLVAWQEWGIYNPLIRSRRTASLGATYRLTENLTSGATLSYGRHEHPAESYEKIDIGVSLAGAI